MQADQHPREASKVEEQQTHARGVACPNNALLDLLDSTAHLSHVGKLKSGPHNEGIKVSKPLYL